MSTASRSGPMLRIRTLSWTGVPGVTSPSSRWVPDDEAYLSCGTGVTETPVCSNGLADGVGVGEGVAAVADVAATAISSAANAAPRADLFSRLRCGSVVTQRRVTT